MDVDLRLIGATEPVVAQGGAQALFDGHVAIAGPGRCVRLVADPSLRFRLCATKRLICRDQQFLETGTILRKHADANGGGGEGFDTLDLERLLGAVEDCACILRQVEVRKIRHENAEHAV